MRFASLGSGSKGNCTVVESGDTRLLIDCGFTVKDTLRRMALKSIEPESVQAVLVTHEHSDHAKGVMSFARRFNCQAYMTYGTAKAIAALERPETVLLNPHQSVTIQDLSVCPVAVPHDAREACQFVLTNGDRKLGVLTDLGSITTHIIESYHGCHGMLLEANHDPQMLAEGPYPASLKRRVGGPFGHLSNSQSAELLDRVDQQKLRHLVACHLSEQNNLPELALDALSQSLGCTPDWLSLADQGDGFDWREL